MNGGGKRSIQPLNMHVAPFPSGGAAAAESGAAQPGDQSALPGGHQPDGPEGLCPALSVPSGKEQLTCQEEEEDEIV